MAKCKKILIKKLMKMNETKKKKFANNLMKQIKKQCQLKKNKTQFC